MTEHTSIRLPDALMARVREIAEAETVSASAAIVLLLREALAVRGKW